jgi:plastocyanin
VTRGRSLLALGLLVSALGFTACGGGDDGGGKAYVPPKGPSTETLTFVAQNYSFTPEKATANAGIATIELTAKSGIHDFVFDDAYPGFRLEADGGGGSQSEKIDLKPGTYTFYCSVTGHRAQGMEGTLTVK